jgi:predicted GIY-YIG superfamily endonuclease
MDLRIDDQHSSPLSSIVMSAKAGIQGNRCSIRHMHPCVYILAADRNGTLYIGVTNNIARRAREHKSDVVEGFTERYGVHRLVYVEFHATMPDAILREKKQLKKCDARGSSD